MKLRWIATLGIGFVASSALAADKLELQDQKQKVSYSQGMNLGSYLKRQETDYDLEVLLQAIKDVLSGRPTLLTDQEAREVMTAYRKEQRAKQEEQNRILGEKNKKEGAEFLAANAAKEGVKVLPSGLQYKVITDGQGPVPKTNDTVTVQYRGTLIDGKEFDSSYKRGTPATYAVTGVIKGWTEALRMMKVGSKWQLFIPSNLAYGERGYGRDIAPNAALIFEIELVGIKPPLVNAGAVAPASQPVISDIIKVPSKAELEKGAKIEIIKAEEANKQAEKKR